MTTTKLPGGPLEEPQPATSQTSEIDTGGQSGDDTELVDDCDQPLPSIEKVIECINAGWRCSSERLGATSKGTEVCKACAELRVLCGVRKRKLDGTVKML